MTPPPSQRAPLSRDRILATAVDLADRTGLEGVSMRHLATELGVVPMALYKHIANKEALLDGLAEALIAEIPPAEAGPWKAAVRTRILAARAVLLDHPWAAEVITTRTTPSPAALAGLDERFRETVVLVDVHDLSYAEAAAVLGVPVGTVMSRLSRGRNRLRAALGPTFLTPGRPS